MIGLAAGLAVVGVGVRSGIMVASDRRQSRRRQSDGFCSICSATNQSTRSSNGGDGDPVIQPPAVVAPTELCRPRRSAQPQRRVKFDMVGLIAKVEASVVRIRCKVSGQRDRKRICRGHEGTIVTNVHVIARIRPVEFRMAKAHHRVPPLEKKIFDLKIDLPPETDAGSIGDAVTPKGLEVVSFGAAWIVVHLDRGMSVPCDP